MSVVLHIMQILASFELRNFATRVAAACAPGRVPVPAPSACTRRGRNAVDQLHATHLAHTRQHFSSQTALGRRSPIWRTYAKRKVTGRKYPNEGWGGAIGVHHVDRG